MPLRIISSDAAGRIDGTVKATILDRLIARPGTPDVTIVPVGNFPNFEFAPELKYIKGPWILVDFLEYGAQWTGGRSHLLGTMPDDPPDVVNGPGWEDLELFCHRNPPALYLKRELMARDVSERVKPIDWTCGQPAPPIQTRAEFDARPIEVFHCWGYSNPLRPQLHAAIFEAMATRGIDVIDKSEQLHGRDYTGRRTWMTVYAPWQHRYMMQDVMRWQQLSKISVSLPGYGMKCFRHAEAPVGAVMAMTHDHLAWSFPWVGGKNCVEFGRDAILDLDFWDEATSGERLYACYRNGQDTIDRYRPDRYVDEYLIPLIERAVA